MAQLFVSHSSADNELAGLVKDCLAGLGYESVFLDFDPTGGLVPGQAWRDQLFTNLDGCDAVVYLTTPAANASQWCHSELALTRWLRKPILALLFGDVSPHPLTADLQGLHLAAGAIDPGRVRRALVALGLDQEARWDPARSPFPGLRAFDESYSAVFFGRDRQIDQLRQLVDPPSRAREGAIIPVLGPSGSGKSSLVRAGLVPALRVGADWVVSEPWTPSDVPLAEMSLALAHAAKRHDVDLDADRCAELLQRPGGIGEYLRALRDTGSATADTKILVVVDQAEELVTITSEAERRAFLSALTTSCTAPSPLRVVMTARTDMWDRVAAETAQFAMSVAPTVLHVPPLSRTDLAQVIREPSRRSHLTLEDGLLERLVDDTGSGDALPLLAFTLARMSGEARDGRLTNAAYDAIGGVQGAIASRAAEVARGGRTETQVAEAILHLVSLTDATPHKRLARAADIPPDHRVILDELVNARLVVVTEVNDEQVYAPAHEALLSAWPPLARLIETRREDLLVRARLERRATDWREAGSTGSGLLSGLELEQARDWQARSRDLAAPAVRAYVDASTARQRRTRLVRAGVSALVLVLAVAVIAVLLFSSHRLQQQADTSRVGELRAIAEREQVDDPTAAAVALLEALRIDPADRKTRDLAARLIASPARDVAHTDRSFLGLATGGGVTVAIDGQAPTVWDTTRESVRHNLPTSSIVAVRPDGRVAAAGTPNGVGLYDLAAEQATDLADVGTAPGLLAWSPDGALLAESTGTAVTIWDARDPTAPQTLAQWRAPGTTVTALALLDDGRVFVSGDAATLVEWDPSQPDRSHPIVPAGSTPGLAPVTSLGVDVRHDVAMLGRLGLGPASEVVDLTDGSVTHSFTAADPRTPEASALNSLALTTASAFDPSTDRVVAVDLGARGYVFDGTAGTFATALAGGHTAPVLKTSFTGDGDVVTASIDGSVRLWDPDPPEPTTTGSVKDRLCAVFGPRIDADSWKLAMGTRTFASPCPRAPSSREPALSVDADTPTVRAPAAPGPGRSVVTEDFSGRGMFSVGRGAQGQGSYEQSSAQGRYTFSVTGIGSFDLWNPVGVPALGAAWSVSADVSDGAPGFCGVMAGDGTHAVTATVDAAHSRGQLSWYAVPAGAQAYSFVGRVGFPVAADATGPLRLARDDGRLMVLSGDTILASVNDSTTLAPTQAGLDVFGDTNSCTFDDFAVTD